MKDSVMPSGVEHWDALKLDPQGAGVKDSVMPSGVEHRRRSLSSRHRRRVKDSVMPSGVEHLVVRGVPDIIPLCERFSDAVRR